MTAIIGAFARVDVETAERVRERLARLHGVEPFDLDERGKLGLLIEAPDVDAAHARLTRDVGGTEGVMGAWPIYAREVDEGSLR